MYGHITEETRNSNKFMFENTITKGLFEICGLVSGHNTKN
jgi:hypothetical protein